MPRRDYVNCFKCADDDDEVDTTDIGYSRLDNSNDQVTIGNNNRQCTDTDGNDENDYFRSADSYQWNPADRDQGQEGEELGGQGFDNYTGIHIQRSEKKRKLKPKGFRAQMRQFFHSSWKWLKRGFVMIAPTVTAGMTFNPTSSYVISANARRMVAQGKFKTKVDL